MRLSKTTQKILAVKLALLAALPAMRVDAAELILPQNRNAFYSDEAIEIAVAGLAKGEAAQVELAPVDVRSTTVKFELKGDGASITARLQPRTLAPGDYNLRLDGKEAAKVKISQGVLASTMLVSQTAGPTDLKDGGGNFFLGNAFSFGLVDGTGQPLKTGLRPRQSPGMGVFDRTIAADVPTLVYMYWTGYVTHKPWGTEKSWANADMARMMRLFNFHIAQRLRRYDRNIISIGTLDEPGLSWGRTPAGGMASGFPNWDEQPWYEQRGWSYTDDPASRSDEDWMKYMTVRAAIMKENSHQAAKDLKTVWPSAVFSTDLYAPQAVMDGTDPLNQQVNDIPSTHVFMDWGTGKLGVIGAIYLEKAHDPTAKIAHAMNGQLFGERVPQPQQRYAYHLMMNGMLASGLHSNWWLNYGGMTKDDLKAVNEPAARLGPLFQAMTPRADTAILWSFTEAAMRQKSMAASEAKKKDGEQIKLMIASWPETNDAAGTSEQVANAYSVGGNYKEQICNVHQSISRSGYPAHILHERILPEGALKNYNTLVIVGQTFELPANVRKAIADFTARGGKVVIDKTTTTKYPGAITTESNFQDPAFRWGGVFNLSPNNKITAKQASYYQTNHFMDDLARAAMPAMKKVLRQTKATPVFTTDSPWLAGERHIGGEGSLMMVLNGYEQLPEIKDDQRYFIYNYSPFETSYKLSGIPAKSVVYAVEGLDWKKVNRLPNPNAIQAQKFEPGEMKLYLVAPRAPSGLKLEAKYAEGALNITTKLANLKMPWPLQVTIKAPDGSVLYDVSRSTENTGQFRESFSLGSNAAVGLYEVAVTSPIEAEKMRAKQAVPVKAVAPTPVIIAGDVRIFDEAAIKSFLASKPSITVAYANDAQQVQAEKLAAAFNEKGVAARVAPVTQVTQKALYPRIWNPVAKVFSAGSATLPEGADVKTRITLTGNKNGGYTVVDAEGKDLGTEWKRPSSLVTVAGDGFVDFTGDQEMVFEPGVQIYFNDKTQMQVVTGASRDVQTTDEFKKKWNRPWTRLTTHVGGFQLPPELPEAYETNEHLILMGDSNSSELAAALQASELLPQMVDASYPGAGKALVQFAWSPFNVEKNVIFIGASDGAGVDAGIMKLAELLPQK